MINKYSARNERYLNLIRILATMPPVKQVSAGEAATDPVEVAAEAADGLLDIEGSAALLFGTLLPRLESAIAGDESVNELLDDIAEKDRHIYYHLSHTRLFDYIVER
jgi:hypothetical protein